MPRGLYLSEDVRSLIIKKFQDGEKQIEIAKQLRLHRSVVCKTIKLFNARGTIKSAKKCGRPRKSTAQTDRLLMRLSRGDPFKTAVDLSSEMPEPKLSVQTIRRRLTEQGLYGRRPAKKPFISAKNRQRRLQFALDHRDWTPQKWKNVLFSDESKFNLHNSDGIVWVRRPTNSRMNPKYTKGTIKFGGGSVMVWGCFSGHGMGPIRFIEGIMDRFVYVDILKNAMVPFAEDNLPLLWRFQHDNDPKHTAKIVKEYLEEEQIRVMDWPPQSPDLNPIENLWDYVERELRNKYPQKFTKKDDLAKALLETWRQIPQPYIDNLISSMQRRCLAVIKSKGFATKY